MPEHEELESLRTAAVFSRMVQLASAKPEDAPGLAAKSFT